MTEQQLTEANEARRKIEQIEACIKHCDNQVPLIDFEWYGVRLNPGTLADVRRLVLNDLNTRLIQARYDFEQL